MPREPTEALESSSSQSLAHSVRSHPSQRSCENPGSKRTRPRFLCEQWMTRSQGRRKREETGPASGRRLGVGGDRFRPSHSGATNQDIPPAGLAQRVQRVHTTGRPGRDNWCTRQGKEGGETKGASPRNRKPEAPIVFPNLPLERGVRFGGGPTRHRETEAVGGYVLRSLGTPKSRREGGRLPARTRGGRTGFWARTRVARDLRCRGVWFDAGCSGTSLASGGQRPTPERLLFNGS